MAGTFTVTATNGVGTGDPSAVSNSVTPRANQAITFDPAPTVVVGGTGVVSATGGSSGNPVVFTSSTTDTCTVSGTNGSTVTGVTVGTCIIAANQAGSAAFNAAPEVTRNFAIGQGTQTINFGAAPTVAVGGTGTVSATGGASGNPVTFTSQSTGVCAVSGTNGSTVTGAAAGTCTIAANQAGNSNYTAASEVTQAFSIGQGSQSIFFAPLQDRLDSDSPFTVSATGGNSSQPVTFASLTSGVCTTSGTNGSTVTLQVGSLRTCTIRVSQAGDTKYTAAADVDRSFQVTASNQPPTISLPAALTLLEDGSHSVSITVGDDLTPAAAFTLKANSSNPALISDAALAAGLGGSGAMRSLILTPAADASGSAVITVTVSDGSNASGQAQLTLTVTPVNDPRSASVGPNQSWPAGESGSRQVAGFVSNVSPGPANEARQTVSFELAIEADPVGLLSDTPRVDAQGSLSYTLTGNSGAARLRVQAVDDGGTANGGIDRGPIVTRRISVGGGVDNSPQINRAAPATKHLPDALAKGATMASYTIEVRNNSEEDANGLRLVVSPIGLNEVLWTCGTPCTPPNGSDGIDTVTNLQAGADLSISLTGAKDSSAAFVEITAQASLPEGTTVLLRDDDRRVFIEPASPTAVYRSGFE